MLGGPLDDRCLQEPVGIHSVVIALFESGSEVGDLEPDEKCFPWKLLVLCVTD